VFEAEQREEAALRSSADSERNVQQPSPSRYFIVAVCVSLLLENLGCGSSSIKSGSGSPSAPSSNVPQAAHVVLIVEENHSYEEVIGNSSMPYLNGLATKYGLATNYFANTHPSIGNYFMLTTGQTITNDDTFSATVDADSIVRELLASGMTWKVYAESIPNAGYTGGDSYPYVRHHNPASYFSDVVNDSTQAANLVPLPQLATDLTNNALPNFAMVIPNMLHDAHEGSLEDADSWLKDNIDPVVMNPSFQSDGLLIIVFDESENSDVAHGGGHVPGILVSSKVQAGFRSTAFYQHERI
jgi:acid phosphatase